MSYTPDKIRNIMIAGHSDSGKTTLAEALLFTGKAIDRQGRTEEGNTTMDYDPEEVRRGGTLSTSIAPIEYNDIKINLVDTPGLFDFELGLMEGIMAVESVLVIVSARSGLTVGAEKAYRLAQQYNKARMFFVGKMDTEAADFYKVFDQLKSTFGNSICPVVVPFKEDGKVTYINLIENKAYTYEGGNAVSAPMPEMGNLMDSLHNAMQEAVAETDDALMEKFFEGEEFTQEELTEGLRIGVKTGTITPVLCGVPTNGAGMDMLLACMRRLLPSAHRGGAMRALVNGEEAMIECDPEGRLAAYVFKTVADPFVGKLSYVKVVHGVLKADLPLLNARTGEPEKMGKLIFLKGKKQTETKEITAGDIGAVTKLTSTRTGDTLCSPKHVVQIEKPQFPKPTYGMAIKPKNKGDESKIALALQRLLEEDETLAYQLDKETMQQILSGLGEQHLDVVIAKLKNKFGIDVEVEPPRVGYREAIRKKVKAQGRHKKQTGGHGQFGDVIIEFEPCDSDQLVFEEKVFGGSVPKNYFPAVEKGLREAVSRGVLAGYPVVGLKATLLDGSYHPVDSSEMAFKMAARLAYRNALPDSSPVLLEPIGTLQAFVPDTNTGDIMGEVNKRRGRVIGMNPAEDGMQCVEAEVPVSEMHDFTTYMRQLTQGRGRFEFAFVRYEPLPAHLEEKVIEDAKKYIDERIEEE